MGKNKVVTTNKDQSVAIITDIQNQIRADHLKSDLKIIKNDYQNARHELRIGLSSINQIIKSNRGGEKGMHGFIGERTQVYISNANALAIGEKPIHTLIDNNGPIDYLRGSTLIQQKACRSGGMFGLDHIQSHANYYPNYVSEGGIYQIPKDFYEEYCKHLDTPKNLACKMPNEDYHRWQKMQGFTQENPDITIEPMLVTYDEIQAGTIEETFQDFSEDHMQIRDQRAQNATYMHRANIKEIAYVTACSAALEGTVDGVLCFANKLISGKKLSEFDTDDIRNISIETAIGIGKGAIRGAAVYTLTNTINMPAPIATASVTAAFEIAEEAYKFANGELNGNVFAKNSIYHCIDVTVSATSSMLGAKYITKLLPSKYKSFAILGSIIGNSVGMLVYGLAKSEINKIAS